MRTYLLFILLICSTKLYAQEDSTRWGFRFGAGPAILGSGDMWALNFENELGYKLNRHISSALSLQFGRSNSGVWETTSFTQGNLNAFYSPFGNNRKNDLRIGGGTSYYGITDVYLTSAYYENNVLIDQDFAIEMRRSWGYNIIIENIYALSNRFDIGIKLFTQSYFNGDMNTGLLFKVGVKF